MVNQLLKNKKIKAILKFLLSLGILYHLAMIFITPQQMSLVREKLMPYFNAYAQTLYLSSSWNFYAPNPSYYHYFEYETIDDKDNVAVFRWPPARKESKKIYLNHNRLIYHSRFFVLFGPNNIRKYFLPYLCRLHPTTKTISIKLKWENRPHFKKAKTYGPGYFSAENLDNMKEFQAVTMYCKRRKKVRNIDNFS